MLKMYLILILFALVACETSTQKAENNSDQKAAEATVLPTTPSAPVSSPTAKITPKQVRETFEKGVLKRLLAQEEGRKINVDNPYIEDGLLVFVADIDGDGQEEGIVQYTIIAGTNETAATTLDGIYIYPSKDGKLLEIDMKRVELPASTAYIQHINNGVWTFKLFDYAEGDADCCPSIEVEGQYQLTELDDWKKVD